MLNLKKTAVAVLALGSSVAFAGSMGPVCSAVNVTVPCESTAWDFGVKALYLEALTSSAIGYHGFHHDAVNNIFDFADTYNKYNWGFMLEGSYHFNTGNDVNVNWYHLGQNHNRRHYGAGAFVANGLPGALATSVSASPDWDAINVEFGQHVDFSQQVHSRFHAGGQFVRIKNNLTMSLDGVAGTTGFLGQVYQNTSFNGFGPRFGMDSSYDWNNGFSVYGNVAGAVIVGTAKHSRSVSSNNALIMPAFALNASKTELVPELEGKLGIAYDYAMAQGDLTIDAGWMWVKYIDALQGSGFPVVPSVVASSFGVQGPYVGLKWVGNVA